MTEASEPWPSSGAGLLVVPVLGVGEVSSGARLADLLLDALTASGDTLRAGDCLVVSSKVVSKAEGRVVAADDREQAITDETVRVVATREHAAGVTRIVENRLGLVMAAAGVDASNTPVGTVLLLPVDPDASARVLRAGVAAAFGGARIGVVLSDTAGRPWRQGLTDLAIGAAGVQVLVTFTRTAPRRRVDRALLEHAGPAAHVFVCGSTAFVESAAALLIGLGHDRELVRTERFGGAV